MRRRVKFEIFGLITLGVVGAGGVNVGALSYQSNVGVGFTFEPTLNVTLSSADLTISNLTPGTDAEDSNIITVGVSTNAAYGYNLLATAGNATNATTNLVNGSNSFAALSSNVGSLNGFSDNTWGYSYCITNCDTATNWVSGSQGSTSEGYAGLPLYTGTGVQLTGADDKTSSSAQFKIAAKAGATQASGTYTNVVNFYAVTNVGPMSLLDAFIASDAEQINGYYKMQDMTSSICNAVDNSLIPSELQLIDERDNKLYWVAKLADGNCWMTQNLDLAGGTVLSADDTDVDSSYISSFTTSNNLTKTNDTLVLPASAVKNSDNNNLTDSSQFSINNYAYVYNSGNTTGCGASGQNIPCYSYYSWDVATLGSGRSISTDNTDAPYSICPKGWKLPSTYNGSGTAAEATDFRALMIALGGSNSIQTYNSSTSPTGAAMYNAIKAGTAPNFLLAGYYNSGSFYYGGSYGFYWPSTSSSSSSNARLLTFKSSDVDSASGDSRRYGFSVRCLLRQ